MPKDPKKTYWGRSNQRRSRLFHNGIDLPNNRLDLQKQIRSTDIPSKATEGGETLKAEKLERLKYSGGSVWYFTSVNQQFTGKRGMI